MFEKSSATLTEIIVMTKQINSINPVNVNGFSVCIQSKILTVGMRIVLNRKIAIIIAIVFFIMFLLMLIDFFKDCVDYN